MIATITRFEETIAVLSTNDGYEIKFPIAKLPTDCLIGTTLNITVSQELDNEKEQQGLAKKILNEILNIDTNSDVGTK
jgi:hypothetical protein